MVIRIALVVLFAALGAVGGQGFKWARRFVASISFGSGIALMAYFEGKLGVLTVIGCAWYCPSLLIFKYGVNDGNIWAKIKLRGLYGLSLGLSAVLIGLDSGLLSIGLYQLALACGASVFFGVLNPFPSSWGNWATVAEDFCIYSLCVCLVPFMV